jgi:hypothetical protein
MVIQWDLEQLEKVKKITKTKGTHRELVVYDVIRHSTTLEKRNLKPIINPDTK